MELIHFTCTVDGWSTYMYMYLYGRVTCPAVGSVTKSALEEEDWWADVFINLFTTELANFFSTTVGGASAGCDIICLKSKTGR